MSVGQPDTSGAPDLVATLATAPAAAVDGSALETAAPRRRLLVIVNPYATTVSDRLRHLVVNALRGSFEVDAVDTQRRRHATELCRHAAEQGYDAVVAFGGDGTVNEAANGLAGSQVPLTCLPGGRVNVYCRVLGIPADVVDATEHLLGLAERWAPRRVDLGQLNDRRFVINAGVGLDAAVVEQVDAHPSLKTRYGEYYYMAVATSTFLRRYLRRPPRLRLSVTQVENGADVPEPSEGILAIVQNASPYTYFGDRPIELASGATLTSGDLAGVVLARATPLALPTISWRALSSQRAVADHRQVRAFAQVRALSVTSVDGSALPLQVDGDYIGEATQATIRILPDALSVIA